MTRPLTPRRWFAALLTAVLALALVACGDDGGSGEGPAAGDPAPAEEIEALPDLDPVFADDLEGDDNGWGESATEAFTAAFGPAGYEVATAGTANWFGYPDAGPPSMEASTTMATVSDPTGPSSRWFGVVCRVQRAGPNGYYALVVDNEAGAWAIQRWSSVTPDAPAVLAEGEDGSLVGVGVDEEVTVAGTCLGDGGGDEVDLVLTVGGDEVGRATDDDGLAAGISGLTLGPIDPDGTADAVTFTAYDLAGDEGDADLEFADDFSDPDSGFLTTDQDGTTAGYDGGVYRVGTVAAYTAGLPVRPPLLPAGTVAVTIEGITDAGFAGLCLNGTDGSAYELALSGGGYASLGHYGSDGTFTLIDEVTGAWSGTAPRVTAGWNTDGSSTRLDLYVDEQQLLTAVDDRTVAFSGTAFCGTVSSDAPAGSRLDLTHDDLVVVGEG